MSRTLRQATPSQQYSTCRRHECNALDGKVRESFGEEVLCAQLKHYARGKGECAVEETGEQHLGDIAVSEFVEPRQQLLPPKRSRRHAHLTKRFKN